MNIALVNSGSEPCRECGNRDPILQGGIGTPLHLDLTALFERAWSAREDELTRLFAAERTELEATHREAIVSMEQLLRQEASATKFKMEMAHSEYEDAVEALAARRARRWRVLKRRWQREFEDELTAAVFELKKQTRRA